MAYFYSIKTSGTSEDAVVAEHNEKLNNYLQYGNAVNNRQQVVLADSIRAANHKEPEVEQMNTTMLNFNHNYIMVTVLCCEKAEEAGERETI